MQHLWHVNVLHLWHVQHLWPIPSISVGSHPITGKYRSSQQITLAHMPWWSSSRHSFENGCRSRVPVSLSDSHPMVRFRSLLPKDKVFASQVSSAYSDGIQDVQNAQTMLQFPPLLVPHAAENHLAESVNVHDAAEHNNQGLNSPKVLRRSPTGRSARNR